MEIRKLQVADVFAVARMLGKITKVARLELAKAITSKKPNITELGMVIVQSICVEAEEDLKAWLADLIDKKKDEFMVMDATAIFDIIEGLVEKEDIKDFFARASQLVTKLTPKD